MLRYRYAVCHTPCYSYSLRSGSYLCPSPHFIHYVLRSATITPRSYLRRCFISWLPTCKHTKPTHRREAHFISQANGTILTGFHYASLRHSFTSVAFSPPAANNLACLAACHGCGFVMVFVSPTTDLNKTKTHAKPLRLTVAVYRRFTAF